MLHLIYSYSTKIIIVVSISISAVSEFLWISVVEDEGVCGVVSASLGGCVVDNCGVAIVVTSAASLASDCGGNRSKCLVILMPCFINNYIILTHCSAFLE